MSNERIRWGIDAITGEWASAGDAFKDRSYVCACPDRHPVILRLPTGAPGVGYHRPHFAHKPQVNPDGEKIVSCCRAGGESQDHVDAKHVLRIRQGHYYTELGQCTECGECITADFADGVIKIEQRSDDRCYWYDAVFYERNGQRIALEIWHKHKTGHEKMRKTRESGIQIVEFKSGDVLDMQDSGSQKTMLYNHMFDHQMTCADAVRCLARKAKAAEERREQMAAIARKEEERRKKIEEESIATARKEEERKRKRILETEAAEERKRVCETEAAKRWNIAVAAARAKAQAKKSKGKRTIAKQPTSVQPVVKQDAVQRSEPAEQLTPWGRPFHVFRCEHGISRVRVCAECGNTAPTWETVTMPYIRARRAAGFYPY